MLEEAGAKNRKRALLARSAHERCIRIWAKAGLHLLLLTQVKMLLKLSGHVNKTIKGGLQESQ